MVPAGYHANVRCHRNVAVKRDFVTTVSEPRLRFRCRRSRSAQISSTWRSSAARSPALSTTYVAISRRSSSVGLRGHARLGVGPVDAPGLEPLEPQLAGRLDHDHGLIAADAPGLAATRPAAARRARRSRRAAPRPSRRMNSSLIAGCVIASRSWRDSSSANASLGRARAGRAARRHRGSPSPNRSTSFASAGCPGSTTARDLVGVDDDRAARGKQLGDGGLAGADPAGEPDEQHCSVRSGFGGLVRLARRRRPGAAPRCGGFGARLGAQPRRAASGAASAAVRRFGSRSPRRRPRGAPPSSSAIVGPDVVGPARRRRARRSARGTRPRPRRPRPPA